MSVKARVGGPVEDPDDEALPHWAGVVPLRLVPGLPQPDRGVTAPVPAYLRAPRGRWYTPVPLRGEHVILEPLDMSHVEGLFAALADEEVYRFLVRPVPSTVDDMAGQVAEALHLAEQGARIPYVQRSAATGEVMGTTSYYPDEAHRAVAIGSTVLGRRWWRTGVNPESKLLLMGYAFDELGAVRVEWHTDARNQRSQQAIERLGAVREGVLRRHRQRPDGTWRDSVAYSMTDAEWPDAQARLRERIYGTVAL